MLHKLSYRHCLFKAGVVIALHHLHECPLSPLVELRIAGLHLTVPIVAEPYLVELLTVASDILHSGFLRVLPRLYSILLGR